MEEEISVGVVEEMVENLTKAPPSLVRGVMEVMPKEGSEEREGGM